tara:strand:+ start:556 stop:1089 length:534 start_codon:yes stop_codon:yes gene_type:complete
MSEKTNYWTKKISAQDACIIFGGISPEKDVRSSFQVKALDGRHFFTMDQDGQRKGWTTLVSPGTTQIKSGLDLKAGQNAIFVEAENGDIIVKATDGNIRFEGDKIEFVAREDINMEAHNKIDINSNNVNIDARARMRIRANQFLLLDAPCGMQILSKIIQGVSAATDRPTSYLSTGG